jgi:hypothetical protein
LTDDAIRIMELGTWKAATQADLWTSRDQAAYAARMAESSAAMNLRASKLEDATIVIKERVEHIAVQVDRIAERGRP